MWGANEVEECICAAAVKRGRRERVPDDHLRARRSFSLGTRAYEYGYLMSRCE
jgi:hypothetical protein